MPRNPKRKLALSRSRPAKPPSTAEPLPEPYPDFLRPTPEQCLAVRNALLALHGFPEEFSKYRRPSPSPTASPVDELEPPDVLTRSGSGSTGETVLDGLVSTLLSQNTTDSNSRKAFESLKSAFPTWEEVLVAESKCVENAIRCGGLAVTKAARIKSILSGVREKRGEICLEYLRDMSVDEVKAELSQFKGIGPKTESYLSQIRWLGSLGFGSAPFAHMIMMKAHCIVRYVVLFGFLLTTAAAITTPTPPPTTTITAAATVP